MKYRSLPRSFAMLAGPMFVVACGDLLSSSFGGLSAAPSDAGNDTGVTTVADATADTSEGSDDAGQTQKGLADASDASTADAGDASTTDANDGSALPDGGSVLVASGYDVAVGATDDVIWMLGGTMSADGSYPAYQWNAASNSFELSSYEGIAVAVTGAGPCFVLQDNTVSLSQSSTGPAVFPGAVAGLIGASANSVWVLSDSHQPGVANEYKSYRFDGPNQSFDWESHVYGTRVAVADDGSAWMALVTGGITHSIQDDADGGYEPQTISFPGTATDIGVGAAGVYALGKATDGIPSLFKYSATSNQFTTVLALDATRIAVGTSIVVVIMADGRVVSFPAP